MGSRISKRNDNFSMISISDTLNLEPPKSSCWMNTSLIFLWYLSFGHVYNFNQITEGVENTITQFAFQDYFCTATKKFDKNVSFSSTEHFQINYSHLNAYKYSQFIALGKGIKVIIDCFLDRFIRGELFNSSLSLRSKLPLINLIISRLCANLNIYLLHVEF